MRNTLRSIGLVAVTVAAPSILGCNCDPETPGDAGTDAAIVDTGPSGRDANVDAFRVEPVDAGRDSGPLPDTGVDAATTVSVCGDGAVDGDETCDDGNDDAGDGCSDVCVVEPGWSCSGEPSVCASNCGDGVVGPTEACDDGGNEPQDGCSATCTIEPGWTCPAGSPTAACTTDCGDGATAEGVEECDDGNNTDGDGCDEGTGPDDGAGPAWLPACLDTRCGNGIPTTGEACDDGNLVDGDGCSATCTIE